MQRRESRRRVDGPPGIDVSNRTRHTSGSPSSGTTVGNREPGTGNREPGTGNREPGTGNREPGTGNREPVDPIPPPPCLREYWPECLGVGHYCRGRGYSPPTDTPLDRPVSDETGCAHTWGSVIGRGIFHVSVPAPVRCRHAQRQAHDQAAPVLPLTAVPLARARESSRLPGALLGLAVVPVLRRVPCPLPRELRAPSPLPCGRRLLPAPGWQRRRLLGPHALQCQRLPVAETDWVSGIPAPPVQQLRAQFAHARSPEFCPPAWPARPLLAPAARARLVRGLPPCHG